MQKIVIIALFLITTKIGMLWVQKSPTTDPSSIYQFIQEPVQLNGWTCFYQGELDSLTKEVLGTQYGYIHKYQEDKLQVEAVAVRYQDQKFEAQVHSPLHCLPGSGWEIVRQEEIVQSNGESPFFATLLSIQKGDLNQKVLYWFMINGKTVRNIYQLKWEVLKNRLLRRGISVYFFRLTTLNDALFQDQKEVKNRLLRFARNYIQTLQSTSNP